MQSHTAIARATPVSLDLGSLSVDQILGRHNRLERELARADTAQPRSNALVARLAKDLAASQNAVAAVRQLLA